MIDIYKLHTNVYGLYSIGGLGKKRALPPWGLLRYRGEVTKLFSSFWLIFF